MPSPKGLMGGRVQKEHPVQSRPLEGAQHLWLGLEWEQGALRKAISGEQTPWTYS